MNCIYCKEDISDRANFCPKCKKQIKCLKCYEIMEADSDICIICGEDKKVESSNGNTIKFRETKKTRTFEANFSNEVGQGIGEAFGLLLANKKSAGMQTKNFLKTAVNNLEYNEEGASEAIDTEYAEVPITPSKDRVFEIFNDNGGKITLLETRLKAGSKRDYSIRLAIIYLHYELVKGNAKISREKLNFIIKDASLYDGNFRRWLTNTNLIGVHEDEIELKAPGREKAKEYIDEIFNETLDDKWKLGSTPRRRKKKEEIKND
ncbi:hypothetical protein FIC_00229 [Flavobacteriaceae bacterium 3519-10]|nr:hypothetical protein FIC_00229 [Flavobacteriaceae bacterium 3519-10]